MKALLLIALTLAGIVPASGRAQTRALGPLSFGLRAGRASLHDGMLAAAPKSRARTLDLRAYFTSAASLDNPPSFPCTPGGFLIKQKKEQPLSVEADTLTCEQLFGWGDKSGQPPINKYRPAADTLQYYVDHCHATPGFDARAFSDIASDYVSLHPGGDTMENLRQWFFSVLYLPIDTSSPYNRERYYCYDAIATLVTLNGDTMLQGAAPEAAIEKYLVASGKCPDFQGELENDLSGIYQGWHRFWKDTVTDSLLTPWDTSLPTLQQIGFEILLGQQYGGVAHNGVLPTSVLGEIGISPNPFVERTEINYTLNVPATLTVEVYDVLGNKVAAPVPSVFTRNGYYMLTLGDQVTPGTYYVRFSVPEGEVRTLKITKE